MIELRDTVRVDAAPAKVWGWLDSMPDHYLEWHPDHLAARWVKGGGFAAGAVIEVRERLHGKPHGFRMAVTDVEPGRWVRYRMFPGLRGGLDVRPADGGSEFTASIEMGVRVPALAPLLDGMLRMVFGGRIEALRRHQAEEGANLKELLERPASAGA